MDHDIRRVVFWSSTSGGFSVLKFLYLSSHGSAAANLNVEHFPDSIVRKVFGVAADQLSVDEWFVKNSIEKRAEEAVFEYLVLNRTIELLDLYSRIRPNALRGSTHTGPGKLPLTLHRQQTQLVPWMGVVVLDKGTFTVRYECEVRGNGTLPVYANEGDKKPFYYMKTDGLMIHGL